MATDETCGVFSRLDGALDPERVHRFVVGEDSQPSAMSPEQAEQELGDPFATLVLLQGKFPQTAAECLAAIDEATAEGDPLKDQMSFLVGEGSQIAVEENTTTLGRGLRFIITRGATANGPPDGPDILLSVFHPDQKDIELMAWGPAGRRLQLLPDGRRRPRVGLCGKRTTRALRSDPGQGTV